MITEQQNKLRNRYFNETGKKAYEGIVACGDKVIWLPEYVAWVEKQVINNFVVAPVSVCAEKPPLGLKPRKFVDEDRLREVQGAMVRYYDANKPMPLEWITEYNELAERLH